MHGRSETFGEKRDGGTDWPDRLRVGYLAGKLPRDCSSPEGETKRSLTRVIGKSIARVLAGDCGQPVLFIVRPTRFEAGKGGMNKSNQTVMEPITRVERGGTSANLPKEVGSNSSRRWRLIVVTGILIAGAAAIYLHLIAGQKQEGTKGGIPPLQISTVTAITGDIGVFVEALGTVTPLNTVSLTARVAGQIAKVEYQEGQLVHIGDPLLEIDPAPFQAAVTQAEGQLARDQAQLETTRF